MFPELAALLVMSSDFGRKAHLRTRSYSAHVALNGFYDELISLTDSLIEAYQGRHGIITIPDCVSESPGADTIQVLRKHLAIIEEVRYQAVPQADAPLQSIMDTICVLYLSTLYKLETFT